MTTLQAPPVIKPETEEVRNSSSDTNLRVKKLRSAFYLSSQPTRWYPTTASAPLWATTSPPYWFTTSRAWYHPSTFRIRGSSSRSWYPHSQPTRFTLPWQFYSSRAPGYRYTTSWYPPYRFTTRRYPAYKTTYLPSMTRWHDHPTDQPYTQTTPPYWWHQRSTTKGYRQSTRLWQPKSTYPRYKTTSYPYFRFTTSYPYARKTSSWWYRSTYPKSTKSWYYQNTTPWWHRSTSSWYHSKYHTSRMSSNNPQTIPWWQRPSTPWYYPKTTYPYYKTTYPYYIHTTAVPRSTHYPTIRTKAPATPYWYHRTSKATPNWYPTATHNATLYWYHGPTKATTSWYNPNTAAIVGTKRPIGKLNKM